MFQPQSLVRQTHQQLIRKMASSTPATNPNDPIVYETREHVQWIRLNRPKKFNSMTLDMFEELIGKMKAASEDPDIRFLAMTGTGEYYSSGNDLSKLCLLIAYCWLLLVC